jgi:hypothetical protein
MRLHLHNIGMIKSAEIELNGITVITGENNTGKSTVGKVLYSLYYGLNDLSMNVDAYKIISVRKELAAIDKLFIDNDIRIRDNTFFTIITYDTHDKHLDIEECRNYFELLLNRANEEINDKAAKEKIIKYVKSSLKYLSLDDNDLDFKKYILNISLNNEFNKQINNEFVDENAEIYIENGDNNFRITINNNMVTELSLINSLKFSDVSLFDASFLHFNDYYSFTNRYNSLFQSHYENIIFKIYNKSKLNNNIIEDYFNRNEIQDIEKYFNNLIVGKLSLNDKGRYNYVLNEKNIKSNNMASGLQTVSVIKLLFENGYINENSLFIIDEPEIHLHPKWQIAIAELIVMLSSKTGVTILVTTHSPYFVEAIEVYTKKYKYERKTKYYLTQKNEDFTSKISDVTNNTQQIYKLLAEPFQILENVSAEFDDNECD